MSEKTCQCSLRGRSIGDGCEVCNPELAKEYLAEEKEQAAAEERLAFLGRAMAQRPDYRRFKRR